MKTLAVRIGYYRTVLMEVLSKGRELKITKTLYVNCGKNFMVGRYNKIDEYVEKLATVIKAEFRGSSQNIVLVLPNDMCVDTLVDAFDMDSKNKIKEIRQEALKERHTGLGGLNIMKVGANTYNDIYLVTEFDSKRLGILLDALYKKGISFKQVLSPIYASHHLSRTVTCPLEVINKGNNSSIIKSGTVIINLSINRMTYLFTHNNLPIELRESASTFMSFIEQMGKVGVPFTKVNRILSLIGVEGLDDESYSYTISSNDIDESDIQVLDNLDSLDIAEVESDVTEEPSVVKESGYVINDESLTNNKKKQKRFQITHNYKERAMDIVEEDKQEDADIHLTDEQYQAFEKGLMDMISIIRSETQKNITYFGGSHGVKIANIIVTSDDVKGLGAKIEKYTEVNSGTLNLPPDGVLETEDYTIINNTSHVVGCEQALNLGAILSNFVKGNIYE